jgi:histidinol dehydrogenase
MIEVARLNAHDAGFEAALARLLDRATGADAEVAAVAARIVDDVRARGDTALLEYTNRFDQRRESAMHDLAVPPAACLAALQGLPIALREALETAYGRIHEYALRQKLDGWEFTDNLGNRLGQRVTALERVGIYVPGGKAAYPSSVLMNAVPARVAGVGQIVMCVPAPRGELNPVVLAAARLAGVDRIITVGGAQAIAAMAYGTATVPAVDKIVGPGNAYVAAAKRLVFGQVGIDAIAGPSEIVVICDGGTDPDWIAMDLFSQAEHDEDAQAILISPDAAFLDRVHAAMDQRVRGLPREKIVRASIKLRGALIATRTLAEAVEIANHIAPEHLELSVEKPRELLDQVRNAGAVFIGRYTPEAFGDYCAGPNHVLPTSRAARFSNPLGVYEFQKRTSLIECTPQGAKALASVAGTLADAEGLQAHAASARDRLKQF